MRCFSALVVLSLLLIIPTSDSYADDDDSIVITTATAEESEDDDDEDPETVDTVTTTARAPMPKFTADRSVDVVGEEKILERQADNITDAIAEEPGVYRQATNRGSDSVYLRGLIGPENLILVDGVRFNQSTFRTGPNQYLSTLDPWAMNRIETVRGPGSVLYGSGAMGGVLQMFPRPYAEEEGFSGRAIGTYRSADHTVGGAFDTDWRQDIFAATAGFSHRNHQSLRTGSRGGEDIFMTAEQDGRMLASEYRQTFWRAGGAAELTEDLELTVNYMGGLIEDARRTDQLGRGEIRSADNRDDLAWARLTQDGIGFIDELSVHGAYHRTDELTRRFQCQVDENDSPLVTDLQGCAELREEAITEQRNLNDTVHTVGGGIAAVSFLSIPLRLSYGAEAYRDYVRSSRQDSAGPGTSFETAERGNFADESTYATMGAYTHGEYSAWYSGEHEIVVTGGGRVEHFQALAPQVTDEIGDVEFSNTGFVGALGVSYLQGMHLNVFLNWNQGFRAPNLQEATVLGDSGNFYEVPNPDLGPERNDTFELGARFDFSTIGQVSTSAFASVIRDRITRSATEFDGQEEIDGKPVQERINADLAYFYGAEAQFHSTNFLGFEVFGNLAIIDGAVQSEEVDPGFEAGPLHELFADDVEWTNPRRLPPLQFLAGLTYAVPELWSATFYLQGAGSQTKLSGGDLNDPRICEAAPGVLFAEGECPGTPGWFTLNLRGTYEIDDLLHLNLAVTNLTDRRYQHHGSGVLGAGLQGMATLTFRR